MGSLICFQPPYTCFPRNSAIYLPLTYAIAAFLSLHSLLKMLVGLDKELYLWVSSWSWASIDLPFIVNDGGIAKKWSDVTTILSVGPSPKQHNLGRFWPAMTCCCDGLLVLTKEGTFPSLWQTSESTKKAVKMDIIIAIFPYYMCYCRLQCRDHCHVYQMMDRTYLKFPWRWRIFFFALHYFFQALGAAIWKKNLDIDNKSKWRWNMKIRDEQNPNTWNCLELELDGEKLCILGNPKLYVYCSTHKYVAFKRDQFQN